MDVFRWSSLGNYGFVSINTCMKIEEISEGIVDFPDQGAARRKQMDRLKRAGSQKYKDASYDSEGFLDDFTQNSLYPPKDDTPKRPHLKLVKDAEELPSVKTPTVGAIAYKHNVTVKSIRQQLSKGIKVEMEHTTDPKVAKEIALDHLNEYPDYYDRLENVEETEIYPKQFRKSSGGKMKRLARKYVPGYGKKAADELGMDLAYSGRLDSEYAKIHGDEEAARDSRIAYKAARKLRKIAAK